MGRHLKGLLIAICGLLPSDSVLRAESANRAQGGVSSLHRFSGHLSLGERTLRGPNISYQVLSLAPGIRAAAAPAPNTNILRLPLRAKGGFVLYELRAGRLTTIVGNQRQERREGEFWVVRAGDDVVLETESDNAVVQAIQITGF